jgi:hypothetical protein
VSIEFKQADNTDYLTAACNNIVIGTATSVASYPIGGMPTIEPSGSGVPGYNNVLIGSAISSGNYSNVSIGASVGHNATFTGNSGNNVIIGGYNLAQSSLTASPNVNNNVVIGNLCNYDGTIVNSNILVGTACGQGSNIGSNNTVIGILAQTNKPTAVDNITVIGVNASCNADESIAIGHTASCTQANSIAIGRDATSTHTHSIALGRLASTSAANQLAINLSGGATTTLRTDLLAGSGVFSDTASLTLPFVANKTLAVTLGGVNYAIPLFTT